MPASYQQPDHGCIDCYEINKGFHFVRNDEYKRCDDCGGRVLYFQEVMDHIAELQSEIRSMKEIYERD